MARRPNPYYREPADPTASIGQSLGRALFGDPDMAAQQQDQMAQQAQRDAAAQESTAHARLYGSQADGSDATNTANASLPQMFASMYAPPPAPMVAPTIEASPRWTPGAVHTAALPVAASHGDAAASPAAMWTPGVVSTVAPTIEAGQAPDVTPPAAAPAPADPNTTFRTGLPALLATLAQGGHGAEADKIVRTLAAFGGGGDALQRAGLIAGGASPSADFAGTPERADTIAATSVAADFKKATAVATIDHSHDTAVAGINHASDIPVANIRAAEGATVAGINHAHDIPVAQIAAGGRANVANIKAGNNSLGDMIGSMYPGAHFGSEDRTQAQQSGLIARGATGAVHSYHVPGNGGTAVDMRPIPGVLLGQVVAELKANGATVLEAKDETAPGQGTGPHWHIAVADTGARGGRAAPVNMVSKANGKMIDTELKDRLTNAAGVYDPPVDSVNQAIRQRAITLYQQSGNPVSAVHQALTETATRGAAIRQSMASIGARKAPDGKWYVQQGKHPDGSAAYFQVQH